QAARWRRQVSVTRDGRGQPPGVADDVVAPFPSPPADLGSVGEGFGSRFGLFSALDPQPRLTANPPASSAAPTQRRSMTESLHPRVIADKSGSFCLKSPAAVAAAGLTSHHSIADLADVGLEAVALAGQGLEDAPLCLLRQRVRPAADER